MSRNRIGLIGHFGGNEPFCDGQTVKTKNLFRALSEAFSSEEIKRLDTYYFRKNPFSFLFRTLKVFFSCKNIVILPDANGFKVFLTLFSFLNIFCRRKIHYAVVGGWMPVFVGKHKFYRNMTKRIEGVYVETTSMKNDLEKLGFKNVYILRNFKYIEPLCPEDLTFDNDAPHKLCIFSRIMEEKGVEDAINAITEINNAAGSVVFTLDLFGPIDDGYKTRFEQLQSTFPYYIRYMGMVDSSKSVEILKDYFALLFPTKFYTEGIPGTLIDACAAGVPVITALWGNYGDVFYEGVTGWGYEFGNVDEFKSLLIKAADKPEDFSKMKATALAAADKYLPSSCVEIIAKRIL